MEIMLTTSRRTFAEINTEEDLIPPGAKPGTVPTDVDHATGIERLELIGKMQGIDIFDMRPLDASRKGMFRPRFLIRVVYIQVNGLLIGGEFLQELSRTPLLSMVLVTSSTLVAPVTLLTLTRLTG